jgi:hypothetical protein
MTVKGSPGRKQFLLRLPHNLFESARSYADRDNLSITAYMNRAIETYIEATDEVKSEDAVAVPPQPEARWWAS